MRASLNHVYRLVWDKAHQMWVAVAETSKSQGKSGRSGKAGGVALVSAGLFGLAVGSGAYALPTGGQVSAGNGQISQATNQTTINQQSQNLAINWQTFNIGSGEQVTFNQPNSSAIALNRVLGQNPSTILGQLNANGQVFLLNPNGVLFGQGAQVNVGGLVASTLNLSDSDLLKGNFKFSGNSTAAVTNDGNINTSTGGYVALLGASVTNNGSITAPQGNVSLAAGQQVTLQLANGSLLGLTVNQGAVDALSQNHGLIQANGGQVLLTAEAADALTKAVVNNTGIIEAQTIANKDGKISLLGDMSTGTVNVGGTLDASAPTTGNGGFIETSAAHVHTQDNAVITTKAVNGQTGTWLVDPQDYTIAASGGDQTGAQLTTALTSNNVTLVSSSGTKNANGTGSINVNDNVTWGGTNNNTLTLTAANNININAAMTATGTAGLVLNTATANGGQSAVSGGTVNVGLGGSGFLGQVNLTNTNSLNINTQPFTIISTQTALQAMTGAGNYALGSNLTLSGSFTPIDASTSSPFSGIFEGLGHTLSSLSVNLPYTSNVGLFGASTGTIRNVGLVGGSVTGQYYTGGLVGFKKGGSISNAYNTGAVTGLATAGGLVGYNAGSISNAYSIGAVNVTFTGDGGAAGGLVGTNVGSISNAYSTGAVTGQNGLGGLVGYNSDGSVSNAYSTGAVSGTGNTIGGLMGGNDGGTISNAYSTGAVSGNALIGGLLGVNHGTISSISNAYWDTTTSGQTSSAGGTGLTTLALEKALPTGFSTSVWGNASNQSTPYLLSNAGPVFINTDTSNTLYQIILNVNQLQAINNGSGGNYALGNAIDASGASNFTPIGFGGIFDGLGFTVDDLTINQPTSNYVGLFGFSTGTIRNVGLVGGSVTGHYYTGGLVGENYGIISNAYSTGAVTGQYATGGLVGINYHGSINNAYSTGSVIGPNVTGGLVGYNDGSISNAYNTGLVGPLYGNTTTGGLVGLNDGTISNSYNVGSVTGQYYTGGLVGMNFGSISNSYNTGQAKGFFYVGGLVGGNSSSISNSYNTGVVIGGESHIGGLVGYNRTGGSISNCYNTGYVAGTYYTGGLVGYNSALGSISNSYNTGPVSGVATTGGLVGYNKSGTISSSYWNTTTAGSTGVGLGSSTGATGLTSSQMQLTSSFAGFNFTTTPDATGNNWVMVDADGSLNNAGGAAGSVLPMLASEYATTITNTHQLQLMAMALGANYTLGNNIDASATAPTIATTGLIGSDVWGTGGFVSGGFVPVGNFAHAFTGTLNGLGNTISNLTINRPSLSYVGLFGEVSNTATLSNLNLTNINITGSSIVGGLVGEDYGSITNVTVAGTVNGVNDVAGLVGVLGVGGTVQSSSTSGSATGSGTTIGGLVGYNRGGTISSGSSTDTVSGTNIVGGLVGYNLGTINSNSSAASVVTGVSDVGGLVGYNQGTIANTTATAAGSVSGTSVVGGLVGYNGNSGSITNSNVTTATITGTSSDVGGLVGYNSGGSITGSSASLGSVTGQANLVGGLVGYNVGGAIINSSAAETVKGVSDVGGLVGYEGTGSSISGSSATGSVTGTGNLVGGLVGYNLGTINNNSSAASIVTGVSDVGGLVGYNQGSISNASATAAGSVSGVSVVGGLVGYNGGSISNSNVTTATITGTSSDVGGLVGYNSNGTITGSSASLGTVTSQGNLVGGLVGYNIGGAISNSYAAETVKGVSDVGGLVGDEGTGSSITNSYATGSVTGTSVVGGLVGYNLGSITSAYATGLVVGSSTVGGLVGYNSGSGTIQYGYWDNQTTGQSKSSGGGTGLSTAALQAGLPAGFSTLFWGIDLGQSYPYLLTFH